MICAPRSRLRNELKKASHDAKWQRPAAGLHRVTVSLDSLDEEVAKKMSGRRFGLAPVLAGIDAAKRAGLAPIKLNCVVQRGVNDDTLVDLAEHFRGTGVILRFIEYMDVGTANGWKMDEVVPATEVLDRIGERFPLEPVAPSYAGEVANRYRYADGAGEIGVIASVTRPFCGGCTRARLSPEGKLVTCLFASDGVNLLAPMRAGVDDDALRDLMASTWIARTDRYSEQRTEETTRDDRIEMFHIGG